jgi:hypothetical protein
MEPRSGPSQRFAAGVLAATVVWTPVTIARAGEADQGESIRLEYHASAGCPDRPAFVARVHRKTRRARFVEAGEPGRIFTVDVEAGPPSAGRVTVTAPEGASAARAVQAGSCEEVADALALMLALAVDPQAAATAASGPTPTAPSSPPVPPSDGNVEPPPATPLVPSTAALPPPPRPTPHESPRPVDEPAEDELPHVPPPGQQRGQRLFVGADFAAATGVSPTTLLGAAPFVGYRGSSIGWLAPSIRATFLHAGTGNLTVDGGQAQFTWNVGRLDGCFVAWPTHALRLGLCARVEAGVLDVSGSAIAAPQTKHNGWVAAGPVGHVEWTVLGPLFLDAQAGPIFRVTNDRFYFQPNTTAYQVPIVALDAEAGVGVHFL